MKSIQIPTDWTSVQDNNFIEPELSTVQRWIVHKLQCKINITDAISMRMYKKIGQILGHFPTSILLIGYDHVFQYWLDTLLSVFIKSDQFRFNIIHWFKNELIKSVSDNITSYHSGVPQPNSLLVEFRNNFIRKKHRKFYNFITGLGANDNILFCNKNNTWDIQKIISITDDEIKLDNNEIINPWTDPILEPNMNNQRRLNKSNASSVVIPDLKLITKKIKFKSCQYNKLTKVLVQDQHNKSNIKLPATIKKNHYVTFNKYNVIDEVEIDDINNKYKKVTMYVPESNILFREQITGAELFHLWNYQYKKPKPCDFILDLNDYIQRDVFLVEGTQRMLEFIIWCLDNEFRPCISAIRLIYLFFDPEIKIDFTLSKVNYYLF